MKERGRVMGEFEGAKIGDPVAIVWSYGWSRRLRAEFGEIERVTKTQITACCGRRFMRHHGFEVGTLIDPRGAILRRDTPELRARIAQDAAHDVAEKKCLDWADKLRRARGSDAVALAANLPDLENEG